MNDLQEELISTQYQTELAGDLIRQLAAHVGDPAGVRELLRHWRDVLGPFNFALVCVATTAMTFGECLTVVPAVPEGQTAFATPEETHQ